MHVTFLLIGPSGAFRKPIDFYYWEKKSFIDYKAMDTIIKNNPNILLGNIFMNLKKKKKQGLIHSHIHFYSKLDTVILVVPQFSSALIK